MQPLNIVALIFGGCCSNVFALEALVRSEPSSGILITFFQFVFTALMASFSQLTPSGPSLFKSPTVPLAKWAFIAAMFWGINMLNNWAFAFSISVPVHIILRSFGSATTMLAGWLRGKRYSAVQMLSVACLTAGVLFSAWADSESKGKQMSTNPTTPSSEFYTGLAILLLAQLLSAWMGAYVEDTYATYGASWAENLFYSHLLSLPLFLPLTPTLHTQYARLAATPPLDTTTLIRADSANGAAKFLVRVATPVVRRLPQGVLFLLANAVTQLGCISGVNLLAAGCSAVTVTIVLNIRKLVSFVLSTLLFGHVLGGKMVVGSVVVFGSGALYGWETSWRLPAKRRGEGVEGKKRA